EESGITNLILNEFSATTYHIYEENDREILKISHWYKMAGNAGELKPQLEEGITEVIWKNKEEVKMAMQNTYPNIKLLIDNI
ncbi:MAG: NUDIX hydrolase, partial [Bacteroidota bacterium]